MRKLFIMLLLLSGCGQTKPNNIPDAFLPIYDVFVSEADLHGVQIPILDGLTIQFTNSEPLEEIEGYCDSIGHGNSTISIDETYWNTAGPLGQTVLLFHELGHCLLGEVHTNNPIAIMYPDIETATLYANDPDNWSTMLNTFFKGEN